MMAIGRLGARARVSMSFALGIAALAVSPAVRAQASLSQPYPEGFALNVFDPAPAGDRFFAVPDASSYDDSKLRLIAVGDYVYGTSVERTDDATGAKKSIVSKQLYLHAGAAFPITKWLHASADMPFAAVQKGDAGAASPSGGKFGDLRLGLRAKLVGSNTGAFAFGPGVDVWLPTGSPKNLTSDGAVRVNPRLVASGRIGPFYYEANGGFLGRKHIDDKVSLEVSNAITFGAGAGIFLFKDVVQVGPELWGNHQVSPHWNFTQITPVSSLVGAKVHLGDLELGVAGGPGLSHAPGVAPRIVFTAGLVPHEAPPVTETTKPENADRDHDGIDDSEDACPDRAGVTSPEPDKNGCPEAPKPEAKTIEPVDSDGDGITDDQDACPMEAGEKSDDAKKNGCPKPRVLDTDGDGITDDADACPTENGPASTDPQQNGCPAKVAATPPPVVDTDGDGIPDSADACPNDAGVPSKNRKKNGCPKPEKPVRAARAPKAPKTPMATKGPAITFSGFEEFEDGSSRIYVKLTGDVQVVPHVAGKKAEYALPGVTIPVKNNKNPLITEHFLTSVMSARLMAEHAGKGRHKTYSVRLVVDMREAVTPTNRTEQNSDGTATLVIDFPKPTKTPTPPATPAPPKSVPIDQ